jgi:transcriptional regulator GlxA family with amidase domain
MRELAQSLGISLRSLQLAFQEVHGHGPREALNRIRLEKARQRLLAAREEGRVTAIALESGFSHLSRFAQSYAQAFGERPSETLLRRRA